MRIGRVIAGAVLLLFLPVMAACSSSSSTSEPSSSQPPSAGAPIGGQPAGGGDLNGTKWKLASGPFPDADLAASGISLDFADGTASGSSGVNRYTGTYTSSTDGSLKFGAFATTLMAGPEKAMALEQAYMTTLQQTFGYTLEGDTLTLFGAADQLMVYTAA